MTKLTQSMEQWLTQNYPDKIAPILFGHTEVFTEEMAKEYLEWCKTEEGRQYLKGGSKYDKKHRGNIACDDAWAAAQEG